MTEVDETQSDGTDDVEIYTVTSESTEREVEVTAYLEETDGTPIPDDIIPYVQQLVDCLGFIGNIPFVQQLVRFIVNIPYVQQLVAQSETLLVPAAVAAPNLDPYDTSGWDDEQSDKELYIHANKVAGSIRSSVSMDFPRIHGHSYILNKFKIIQTQDESGNPVRDYFLQILVDAGPGMMYIFARARSSGPVGQPHIQRTHVILMHNRFISCSSSHTSNWSTFSQRSPGHSLTFTC